MNVRHSFPKSIFRAYDIRGKLSFLTTDVVRSIAYGLAQQYKQAKQTQLVIGYDARLTSPAYAHLIEEILVEQGLKVTNIGCCSSPMMYYIARDFGGNGIMVTASHNPKSDNGIKWILKGEPPSPEMIQQVGEEAQTYVPSHSISVLELTLPQFKAEFCQQYQQAIFKDIHLKRPLKVVLDGLHGSAGHCSKLILEKMGCEVIALRTNPNGEFPDHAPDPSHAAHLTHLRKAVVEQQADIGIALDGDGDRVVLVDEKHRY